MKSGQWATFEGSTRSKTAYQLYRTLLSKLSSELRPEYIDQWPVMFRGEQGSLTANESKMRYQEFLKNLKQVCRLLGYDEDMLGTHSLLRGSVTDQFQCGIPGQVIKTSGRWKSADFQHYIDQETILRFDDSIVLHTWFFEARYFLLPSLPCALIRPLPKFLLRSHNILGHQEKTADIFIP
jgi:hypothetical protein